MPNAHVHQRNARYLGGAPEFVESPQSTTLRIRLAKAEQLEIVSLENKSEGLSERRIRHAMQRVVVDVVEREGLFDIVAHLMDRDVVALVIHAACTHTRAQMRLGRTHA